MSISRNKNTFRGFCTLYESVVKMFLSIFTNINGGGVLLFNYSAEFSTGFSPVFSETKFILSRYRRRYFFVRPDTGMLPFVSERRRYFYALNAKTVDEMNEWNNKHSIIKNN